MSTLIFGGTAAYHLNPADYAEIAETRVVETPYGPSPRLFRLITAQGTAVWFGSRHGESGLDRSARFVNHRANLWAAQALGIDNILSWNGVGAINPDLRVGDLLVPDGLMDWTRHRVATFGPTAPHYARAEQLRRAARTIDHINNQQDPTQTAHPFDPALRRLLLTVLPTPQAPRPKPHAPTYLCTEGPRLETAAEITLAATLGADIVGMTLCPELWLAVELDLKVASLCLVSNFATGRWHIDPRREFGPPVAQQALKILLTAVDHLHLEQS